MTHREKLIEILSRYFQIGDSYAYNLMRDKEAFAVGTMSLEDFEEFDDFTVADIVDNLLENGVIVPILRIGQKVWLLVRIYDSKKKTGGIEVVECVISSFSVNQLNQFFTARYMDSEISIHPSEIGESVFLTYDEAEKALKELNNEIQ